MSQYWPILLVFGLGLIGFIVARRCAIAAAGGDARRLHSSPAYHGVHVALFTVLPALFTLMTWSVVQPLIIERSVSASLPAGITADAGALSLILTDIRRVADGLDAALQAGALSEDQIDALDARTTDLRAIFGSVGAATGSNVDPSILAAAREMREIERFGGLAQVALVLGLAVIGLLFALRQTGVAFRARNSVERAVVALLMAASFIAILTTVGIVLSMLFESATFFRQYPAAEFFFGLNWSPNFRGDSDLGILPLLWGTLYISAIALVVAVPTGLFAAIYLSEYAGRQLRAVAKPLIEILAGIPTIVYGLFALVTVGPILRDVFAQPLGLGNSASTVMTAGLVMGVMLIPFVSSLSDDIINAVPQAMRDGSLGLGATRSETIRQVVIPAALPGIVGAVLLAASRAIGETMIVVLGAGAAARLELNPFEAMTTVTVKIVSQLTGDTDFASPETLVAFALGLTLFVITLSLNVVALMIVRRYREQYE